MGADYYIFYKLCIEYIKDGKREVKEHALEETREKGYWDAKERGDDEQYIDYVERCEGERRDQIDAEMEEFPYTEVFKAGEWYCNDSYKEKYQSLMKMFGISEWSVQGIWLQGEFSMR
jgi:hypothetical protein